MSEYFHMGQLTKFTLLGLSTGRHIETLPCLTGYSRLKMSIIRCQGLLKSRRDELVPAVCYDDRCM